MAAINQCFLLVGFISTPPLHTGKQHSFVTASICLPLAYPAPKIKHSALFFRQIFPGAERQPAGFEPSISHKIVDCYTTVLWLPLTKVLKNGWL